MEQTKTAKKHQQKQGKHSTTHALSNLKNYQKSLTQLFNELTSQQNGLSESDIQQRVHDYGYNEIKEKAQTPLWRLFAETLKDVMVIVLLIVSVVQAIIGAYLEAAVIFGVLLMNTVVSVIQTRKAENSLDALKQLSAPHATVVREGEKKTIPAREIIPGDIVVLEAGDYVPADGRLFTSESLKIDEGMLTGESVPAEKGLAEIQGVVPLGDRSNMVYSGTMVVYGRGSFLVTETGSQTEIGQVANLLEGASNAPTPLQKNLDKFSQKLGVAILMLSLIILGIQLIRIFLSGTSELLPSILNAFMFAVAVAVAAIPEALQSIVTIVLSLGTKKMAKEHAIIRTLSAVETLGATSLIATDKTGTLTQNRMTVTATYLPERRKNTWTSSQDQWMLGETWLTRITVLTNDASSSGEDGQSLGDPTEIALLNFAADNQIDIEELRRDHPREAELPFDSNRKLMSTVHTFDGHSYLLTKGAPDILLKHATQVLAGDTIIPLTDTLLHEFQQQNERFSEQALRVLAYGFKQLPAASATLADESARVFVGFTAMIDPPREEVYEAIRNAKSAGIKTVMITGDHKTTAQAIAKQIGLSNEGDLALTGSELDNLSDKQLQLQLERISVYARVSPENKIRIVRAWQEKGHISAMTGDGVNDAPALKQADIGVAMGTGTDVAKDSAAMVLTDDNFASIVKAIAVGRNVFDNIQKAVAYLFAGNLGAIIAIVFALLMDWTNPFTALQLLFINLVNDSLPAIALGMEKSEPRIMERLPRNPETGIFSGDTLKSVVYRGLLIGAAVITAQWIGLQASPEMGGALAFATLILSRTLQTFPARSNTQTSWSAGLFTNKMVWYAIGFSSLLFGLTLLPGVRSLFAIPIDFGFSQLLVAFGLAITAILLMEITKQLTVHK